MNSVRIEACGGLILCGGRSSRMGHDKARLRFPGGTLLERTLERMNRVTGRIVLSLANGQPNPEAASPAGGAELVTVQDTEPDQGPLQGMLEGFRKLAPECDRVLVLPVDMPFFTEAHMRTLVEGLESHQACLYESEGFVNALTAAYDLSLLPRLEDLVASGRRRPLILSEDCPRRVLQPTDPGGPGHPMQDVDTPEAYRAALLAEGVGTPGGAEVSVTVTLPGMTEDFIALHANTAGEAMLALKALAAPAWFSSPESAFALFPEEARDAPLPPNAALHNGQRLRLSNAEI